MFILELARIIESERRRQLGSRLVERAARERPHSDALARTGSQSPPSQRPRPGVRVSGTGGRQSNRGPARTRETCSEA
jgi:hypothetical protein